MKKKVRIYKSPDGKGKFVNKTAKFLRKAQEGGQQDKQAQLADYVYKTLDDAEPFEFESIKESLINELASAQIPIDQAEGMVENIAASLSNETAQADELAGQEETDVYDQAQEDLRAQEEAAAAAEEERQAGLAQDYGYYDDTAAQGEDEEDEEDYDDEEEASYMQMGGDLIPEPNAVSFTGYDPEQYAQDSMNSFSKGGITKRKYIGSVMKMLKKQDGGEGEKDSQMDPMDTASNEKKRKKDAFIGALASSAQEAKMKEKAEAMWEQEQQAMMQQQAPQYPMQAPMEQVPMARRGMSVRQMRRLMPRGFGRGQMRSFAGMVPQGGMFPMGMNIMTYPQMQMPEQKPIHVQGTPQGMKLDVRKSNWLTGRPSQYSIEFGGDAAIPGFNMMPGMGYGAKSKQRKTIEGVSRLVNKNADPANDINKGKGGYDVDGNGVPDNIQSNPISTTSNLSIELDKNRNGILDTTEVATNLPGTAKTATNINKDATGNGSKLPSKSATAKTNTANASKNAGQSRTPLSKAPITNKAPLKNASKVTVKNSSSWKQPASYYETGYDPNKTNGIPNWLFNAGTPSKSAPAAPSSDGGVWNTVKNGLNFLYPGMGNLQDGGFVDSSNPDLYKFIYGGNEQFPDPITQQDMDYADSKNTGSPYFANGGYVKYKDKGEVKSWDKDGDGVPDSVQLPGVTTTKTEEIKKEEPKKSEFEAITSKEDYDKRLAEERKKWQEDNAPEDQEEYSQNGYRGYTGYPQNAFNRYFPANTIRKLGTYSQQMGMPYGADGAAYTGGFGPNTNLTKIDVRKSGWLSGKPRKYTMHFNNYSIDPALSKYLDETEGSGSQSKASNSGDGSANIEQPNSDGIYPSTGTSFPPEESTTRKMRRENRRHDKFIAEGWKMPDGEEEEDVTEGGPSAEEIASRDAATLANKDVVREFSDVEGVQNDPFGFGSGGVDETPTDFEESIRTYDSPEAANEYVQGEWGDIMTDVSEVLGPESQQEFDKFLATNPTKGAIDAKIESFMAKRNEAIGKDESAVERNELTADPEEEMLNQQAMRRNPMFMGNSNSFGANPEIATGNDYQLSERDQAQMDQIMQNRKSIAPGFQPYNTSKKPTEDLDDLAYWGDDTKAPALPASLLENQSSNPGVRNFQQYSGPFEGAASNDDMNLYGTMDGMSEGSVRNREIAAKQKYQQQQQAIKQQQIQQQQIRQQQIQAQKSGQNQSGSQGSNANAAANDGKSEYYDPKTFGAQGIVQMAKKDKDGYASLLDSDLGQKTLFAIDYQWEKDPSMKKKYGSYENYLKTFGYWDLVQAQKKKTEKNDADRKKVNSKKTASKHTPQSTNNMFGFQDGGNLNRFVYGDEVTKVSTDTPSPVSNINNPIMSFLKYDDSGQLIIPGFPSPEQDKKKNDMKLSLYEGYGEGDDFSAAPAGSTFTKDEEGNDVVISPDEARKRIEENSFAVDFKNKNMYEADSKDVNASANALGNAVFNRMERRGERKANKNFHDIFTADNLYAGDPIRDRGDYESNSGLYRPDEQGQTWNSRSARYGGFMQEGGFVEGDIVDMTQEEIEEFLANGGELEMIS